MNYKNSRNLAWQLLIKNGISQLPVDVIKICRAEGITLFTYRSGKNFIKELNLEEHLQENDAFSVGRIIFYDDTKPTQRQRFSIAHELGHIFLHIGKGAEDATVYNREPWPTNDPIETEANIFASRLLAPLIVLQFLNLNSAKDISECCDISYTAAKYRFDRLCQIRKRNSEARKETGHGTFLLSNLERKVLENFKDYIDAFKKD